MSDGETVAVPRRLLEDVLAGVEDLAELKAILEVLLLSRRDRRVAVSLRLLLTPERARRIAGAHSARPVESRVLEAVRRAVNNGYLVQAAGGDGEVTLLLAGRDADELLDGLRAGDEEVAAALGMEREEAITVQRPNVFALYEQNIGPLTPLVAESLRGAERAYPREWIEDAFQEAVNYNKRNWRYIEAILLRWEETGRPHGVSRGSSQARSDGPRTR
jgi:DnaD/phage-associated family protein